MILALACLADSIRIRAGLAQRIQRRKFCRLALTHCSKDCQDRSESHYRYLAGYTVLLYCTFYKYGCSVLNSSSASRL